MNAKVSRNWPMLVVSIVAVVFGVLTIVSGGNVLFGGAAAQAAAGNVVPFVLWFNFLSGFLYVLAGVGIAMNRRWAITLSIVLAAAIAVVFALFGLRVYLGAAYEMRTVGAMSLRLFIWVAITAVAIRYTTKGHSGMS